VTRDTTGASGAPVGRRLVIGMLGLGALGVATGKATQDALARAVAPIQRNDPTGLTDLLPLGDNWRYYSITNSFPAESDAAYRLTVGGLVREPATYTLSQLRALPQTKLVSDFQCVTGWRIPGVHWSGVRLADLLAIAGPRSNAAAVLFKSFDGAYTESLTMDQANRTDVLVALDMLGKPVTRDHGGPVRLYVAPMYGYKSIKWLSEIQVADRVVPGYWEQNGYDVNAWVGKSNGRDDAPTS
jgi:DMSO/TMAO reductase YedYZ molybdopterin-dependent catalytic subunit